MNKNTLWILILPLLILIFFSDIFFSGKTLSSSSLIPGTTPSGPYGFSGYRPQMPFSFDTAGNAWVNEPNPYIIKRELSENTLLEWNPNEGLGMPFIANLNNEVFNPLKVFLNLAPNPFRQDLFFLLRLLVMGIFTYLFLKEKRLSSFASLFGAASFMLSGYSVWWINLHPLSTVMYLPGVFYFYERWCNRKDLKNAFLMSLMLSFALVAGKIPDAIMGLALLFLYAIWRGVVRNHNHHPLTSRERIGKGGDETSGCHSRLSGIFPQEGCRTSRHDKVDGSFLKPMLREMWKVVLVTASGASMAAIALIPFFELYSHASPLAKAIRTGAAGHSIPLVTSVSLFQPLFLGWKNYFYGSWLKWTPDAMLPNLGIVTLTVVIYALLDRKVLRETLPFFAFSLVLFLEVYGLLPSNVISKLPVIRSIEFLKYNSMFYFSLSIISAHAFNALMSPESSGRRLYLSIVAASILILVYFVILHRMSPPGMNDYMIAVLLCSLSGLFVMALSFYIFRNRQISGAVAFLLLIGELLLYMPRDHPDRYYPYERPPYLKVIKERDPYRITGGGSSVPPLVSAAVGLHDIRAISVLMPRDYYVFFESLMGFTLPGTNNPDPLFTGTSPFIDLAGVKYIMSEKPLEKSKLEEEVRSQVGSMRLVRLFEAMKTHSIRGEATYGFFEQGGEKRFSLFFPMRFTFETRLRITEPFIAAGFTLTDVPKGSAASVKMKVKDRIVEASIGEGSWKDQWLDVSDYIGKFVTLRIEGTNSGTGRIVVGNVGLSPGPEKEGVLYNNLLMLHKKEFDILRYLGEYEGMHIYENSNVMSRAFMLHRVKAAKDLDDTIRQLQEGLNFREVGLVTSHALLSADGKGSKGLSLLDGENPSVGRTSQEDGSEGDKVVIKKYTPEEIAIEVSSKGGLLVLSDLYYPGWKVKVNGRESRIVKVFGLFRGVLVGGGKTEVLFYYRPMSLYAGFIISILTFITWSVILMASRKKAASR